jgi:thrombospondin type 3 repeat protein
MRIIKLFKTGLCSFILTLFLAAPSWATTIIDAGAFKGTYNIGGIGSWSAKITPINTLSLAAGTYNLNIESSGFRIDVDSAGNVTNNPTSPSTNTDSFTISGNTITFKNKSVIIDAGASDSPYNINGFFSVSAIADPVKTITLVPGVDRYILVIQSNAFYFDVDAAGNVTNNPTSPSTNTDSFTIAGNTIAFKNKSVIVDAGAYQNTWNLNGSFGVSAILEPIKTITLVPGVDRYIIVIQTNAFYFGVDAAGNVTNNPTSPSTNTDSFTIAGNTIAFKNKSVIVDAGAYQNTYALQGCCAVSAIADPVKTFTLVPGIDRYGLTIQTNTFHFGVDAAGNVINNPTSPSTNTDSFTIAGNTITFKNTPVVIDTVAFQGGYAINGCCSFSAIADPVKTLTLVPGIKRYALSIHGTSFHFSIDAFGNVSDGPTSPRNNSDSFTISGNTITFINSEVSIEPDDPSVPWNLNGVSPSTLGPKTFILVDGVIYRINRHAAPSTSGPFEILHPCAINTGNPNDPELLVLPDSDEDGLPDASDTSFVVMCVSVEPDSDNDGIPDANDNCPNIANGGPGGQVDQDGDGIGDACDPDVDGDTVLNEVDNCPAFPNTDQADADGDNIGDACEEDDDNDSVPDTADNCPLNPNTDQADGDGDGLGNACDPDDDNDTVLDDVDNCPNIANTDQADFNNNGIGDACDADIDGDSVLNEADLCPATPAGSVITLEGCSGAQHIELTCDPANFPNHGGFVSCVAHTANELVGLGIISPKEKARFVNQAAKNK